MGIAGSMALAGAVGGLGNSIVKQAEQAREDALLALKRKWQMEDQSRGRATGGARGMAKPEEPEQFKLSSSQEKAVRDMLESEGYEGIDLERKVGEFRQAASGHFAETGDSTLAFERTISGARPDTATVTEQPGLIGRMIGKAPTVTEFEEGIRFDGPSSPPTSQDSSSVIEEARAAIAAGAPRDAVIARLREMGVDPAGL